MDVIDKMRTLRDQGQPFVTATVVRVEKPTSAKPGAKAIVTQDGQMSGWIGGSCAEPSVRREALKALQDGRPRLLRLCPPEKMGAEPQEGVSEVKLTCMSGGTLEIFIEPHLTQPQLLVIGHHAIVDALVSLAGNLEFPVTVMGENLIPERFPSASRVINALDFSQLAVTPNTFIVVASHGNYDELALEALLPTKAPYVALVASKKRAGTILEYLRQSGMSEEMIGRLKYPAGLDFGAVTPAEIALSILAEIIQRRGGRTVQIVPAEDEQQAAQEVQAAQGEHAAAEQPAEPDANLAVDPVCGMTVEIDTARYRAAYQGQTYYFCSAGCQRDFEKDPGKYLAQAQASEQSAG